MNNEAVLTVVIITKNEASHLTTCLQSVKFADEIIVIDDNSSDETRQIANQHGARVIQNSLAGNFSMQRNIGLQKAIGKWVLYIDADEQVSPELADEIKKKILGSKCEGYALKRQDRFLSRILRHGETANVRLVRLGKRDAGKWTRNVHEVWNINGNVEELKTPLLHSPHESIHEFLHDINQYTGIEKNLRRAKDRGASFSELVLFPVGKFVKNFIYHRGFLDGFEGFVMAYMMSMHSLILRVKLRE